MRKDITGQKFGALIAKTKLKLNNSGNYEWLCECICGKSVIRTTANLNPNRGLHSCGCLNKRNITHGLTRKEFDPLFRVWGSMKARCGSENQQSYHNYGGRGIKIAWSSFEEFEKDMRDSYKKGLTIERVNVNGNYSKENCRWATPKEQARNTRTNRVIEYSGQTKCLAEWAEEYKIPYQTFYGRIRNGWPIEKALTTPVRK